MHPAQKKFFDQPPETKIIHIGGLPYGSGKSFVFKWLKFFQSRSGEMANSGPVEELADSSLLKSDSLKESVGATPTGATINPWRYCLVNGPYTHDNGRKFVILTSGKHFRKTTSYARYLMEENLGRLLTDKEEVDHINGDFTDDRLENLQIISKADNIRKSLVQESCSRGHIIAIVGRTRGGHCKECECARQKRIRRQK